MTLTGNPPPNGTDHELFALPARLGGLGLHNPATYCESECTASRMISEPLVKLIVKLIEYPYQCQLTANSTVHRQRRQQAAQAAENLKPHLSGRRGHAPL